MNNLVTKGFSFRLLKWKAVRGNGLGVVIDVLGMDVSDGANWEGWVVPGEP
jgi:hypothetical protein